MKFKVNRTRRINVHNIYNNNTHHTCTGRKIFSTWTNTLDGQARIFRPVDRCGHRRKDRFSNTAQTRDLRLTDRHT